MSSSTAAMPNARPKIHEPAPMTPAERKVMVAAISPFFVSEINPTGMFTRVERVTPLRAQNDYDTQPSNRTLRLRRVERLQDDLTHCRWKLHHQGAAYDEEGFLRDGQHRMYAIACYGIPAVMNVSYNVPASSFIEVDNVLVRSLRDSLLMSGKGEFTTSVISTANCMELLPGNITKKAADREETYLVIQRHIQALEWVEALLKSRGGPGGGISRGVRALIARAWYWVDREKLSRFAAVVRTGLAEGAQDSPAIHYRNWLVRTPSSAAADLEVEKYQKGQTCLKAFLEGNTITKVWATTADEYPLTVSPLDRFIDDILDQE